MSNIAEALVTALLRRTLAPLASLEPFDGAGVYALYYFGHFPDYLPIAKRHTDPAQDIPIYVGRATAKGGRKGLAEPDPDRVLYNRLRQHRASIEAAVNLSVDDFWCRWLVVDDIWVPLAERLLLRRYQPVWNVVVEGFGIHDPGAGRKAQRQSAWDALHPGRAFAEGLAKRSGMAEVLRHKIQAHFRAMGLAYQGPDTC